MIANEQRTGTFLCWLFGHKFAIRYKDELTTPNFIHTGYKFSDKCVRCGIDKPERSS